MTRLTDIADDAAEPCPRCGKVWRKGTCTLTESRASLCASKEKARQEAKEATVARTTRKPKATEVQVKELFDRLKDAKWKELERRLIAAYHHNSGARAEPDGYPASVGGGGSGTAELTSVEAAAEQRLRGQSRDRQLERVAYAIDAVHGMVKGLDHLHGLLRGVEANAKVPVEPKVCQSCVRAGLKNEPAHTGSLGGRLVTVMHLCEDCYAFANRTGRIPTVEELQHHERTGRWKVRVA